MRPGKLLLAEGDIEINRGRESVELTVLNGADRPIQVGSHYHFAEANAGLEFDRQAAYGMRLDIPSGTAVRFEPGQSRQVSLIPYDGSRQVIGFNGKVMGRLLPAAIGSADPDMAESG